MHYDQLTAMTAILSESKENSDLSDTNCAYSSSFFSIIRDIFSVDPIPGTRLFSRRGTQTDLFKLLKKCNMLLIKLYLSLNYSINIISGTILYTSSNTLVD